MEKDLIIGACKNYNFEQVKPWIRSINECGFQGDKVLFAFNASKETLRKIEDEGFIAIGGESRENTAFHMERFLHIYNYLNNPVNSYRYVVTTDVRDVIFQRNPIPYIDYLHDCFDVNYIAVSEAIQIKNEKWNRENIINCFGQFFYNQIQDEHVLNVGTLAGEAYHIRDLCAALFQLSLNRNDWVADQAAYNVLMRWHPYINETHITNLDEAFACNLHVTNKPDQLNEFGPFLLEPRPTFENGLVLNQHNQPFCIVHQYDRVPEMKEYYESKYNVENVITFRTDN
jgi:hypothetical protein